MQGEARMSSLELSLLLSPLLFQLSSVLPSYSVHFLYLCKSWEEQTSVQCGREPLAPCSETPPRQGCLQERHVPCAPASLDIFTM